MSLAKLLPNRCYKCGQSDFTFARDYTAYSPCEYDEESGKWVAKYEETQPSDAEDAVRFFCAACGTNHEVPKDLV